MWLFTHLPVSLIAADPAQAAEDAKHVADCLRLMPYMFFCTTVTWLLFLVNACSEASLNIFDQADRNLIEHFLLPHRARLSSHPDAQRVFAAYDATQRISLRSALIRGPTVLTSSY